MVTAGDLADDRSSFPVKGQAPSRTNFKAPANKIEKRQLDNFRRHPEHWLRNATPSVSSSDTALSFHTGCISPPGRRYAPPSSSVMLPAIYGTTFPLGRRTIGCSGVAAQPAIHRA